jgi:trigger factor
MQVTSKKLPKTQVELTIELSVDEVQPYVQKAAQRISKEVNIQGFRKGKVPYDILKQHVGEATVYEEAFNEIVDATYPKAIEQEKLMVAGRAQIDVEKIAPGNPVIFKVTVPLLPTVTLGEYKTLKAKREQPKLDDKKFEKTLHDLRKMRASEKLVDRACKKGDKAVIDFDVKINGVSIEGGQGKEYGLMLEEGQMIPGFVDGVIGMKKEEEKDVDVTFPKDYHKKDIAGAKATVHFKVHNVYEVVLPELSDEVAKEMNFDSLEKLKEAIRENIMKELEHEAREKFEVAVIDEIVGKSTIEELPDQLISEETDKMIRELEHDVTQRGMQFDDYLKHVKKTREELKKELAVTAERRLKAALTVRELAVAEKITVDTAEVEKELTELRKAYANVPEAMERLSSSGQRERIENMLIQKHLFEKLEAYTKK